MKPTHLPVLPAPRALRFVVEITPIGKGRPVFSRRTGRARTPEQTREWEDAFRTRTASVRPLAPFRGPLRLDLLVVLPRPKARYRAKDPDGLMAAPVKPDEDNVRKIIVDAMNPHEDSRGNVTSGFWTDDAQIVHGTTVKAYAEKAGRPRVEVRLVELGEHFDPAEAWGLHDA